VIERGGDAVESTKISLTILSLEIGDAMMCIQSPSLFVPKRVWHVLGAVVCRYFGWSARPLQ
jgi:hypothetical protein